MPSIYIVSCHEDSGKTLNTEFLIKIAHYPQIVRIGETSWLIYTADRIEDVRQHFTLSPGNPCQVTVEDLTTTSDNPAWKDEVIDMMKTLYSKHTWKSN